MLSYLAKRFSRLGSILFAFGGVFPDLFPEWFDIYMKFNIKKARLFGFVAADEPFSYFIALSIAFANCVAMSSVPLRSCAMIVYIPVSTSSAKPCAKWFRPRALP